MTKPARLSFPSYSPALSGVTALREAFPSLPAAALSIRQPWCAFIVHGLKPVENRSWKTNFRGPVLIHAGTRPADAFEGEDEFWQEVLGRPFPEEMLGRGSALAPMGGIVGVADIVDCVTAHPSPWFFGPFGFVLANARPLPFTPCKGALGFFKV